jgi:hypothetical protein
MKALPFATKNEIVNNNTESTCLVYRVFGVEINTRCLDRVERKPSDRCKQNFAKQITFGFNLSVADRESFKLVISLAETFTQTAWTRVRRPRNEIRSPCQKQQQWSSMCSSIEEETRWGFPFVPSQEQCVSRSPIVAPILLCLQSSTA